MLEAGKHGSPNGAALAVATFFIICLESGRLSYYRVKTFAEKLVCPKFPRSFEMLVAFFILASTLLLCAYVLYQYSGPMLLGIERVEYLSFVVPSWVAVVKSLSLQSFFICVMAYLMLKHSFAKKIFGLGSVSVLACLIIVFGEKFSALNLCLMFFFMALAGASPDIKFSRKFWVLCALGFVGVLSLVVYSYISIGRDFRFVFTRIVLQAQVIWSVMEAPLNIEFWWRDGGCFFGCEGFSTGAQYLDYLVLPDALYELYQRSGTSLSGYFPAVLIQQYGFFFALIVAVVGSCLLASVQAFLVIAIRQGALLFSFVLFKIYYMILAFLYFGQIGVFNSMVVGCILIGLIMILLAKKWRSGPLTLNVGK